MIDVPDIGVQTTASYRCEPCGIIFDEEILSTGIPFLTPSCVACVGKTVETSISFILTSLISQFKLSLEKSLLIIAYEGI